MKLPVRIALWVLCAALIVATPFVISSPQILGDAQWEIIDEMDETSRWTLFPTACAEAEWEEAAPAYELPIDRTPGMKPNPANYTESGYEDESISVRMETIEKDGVVWRLAWVNIASPTQLRTNFYAKDIKSNKGYGYVSKMAPSNNAIVAMNGSAFTRDGSKLHSFEIRMGIIRQTKPNKKFDILIIDENADFHLFLKSEGVDTFEQDTGHKIINAFMFGPALVKDGEVLTIPKNYGYNATGKEPRAAFGQIAPLSYVMVVADGRGKSNSDGCTLQELADYMRSLGCEQAYNFDGGNSAILVFNNETYNYKAKERDINDLIYFATAVPEEAWN